MLMNDALAAHIQSIQHTANETMTRVTLTDTETVGEVEKVTTLLIEPMKLEFTSNA